MKEKRAWWIFIGCCMIGLLFVGMICNTAGLYFQDMARELGLPMAKVTLTMSFLNAGGLIGTMFAGRLLMKTDVRVFSSIAAAVAGGGFLLAASSQNIIGFYLLWLLIGICTPFLVTITIPTILGNWFDKNLGMVIGIVYGLSGIGGALFNIVVGQIIASMGWRMAMRLEGLLAMLGMLPFTVFIFKSGSGSGVSVQETGQGVTEKQARTMKSFYLYIAAGMALTIVSSLLQQVSPHITSLGYDITVSSAVMSEVMIGCAVGNVIMGNMLDRFSTAFVIRLYCLFGLAGWLGIAFSAQRVLLMIFGIFIGLAQAIFQTGLPFCYRKTYGSLEFSKISAALALPSSMLAIFSASLGGIIFDLTGSYLPVLILLSMMFVIAEPCIVSVIKNTGKEE